MTEARRLKNERPLTLDDMRDGVQFHRESVSSGYAHRRAQAPGALSRGERVDRGPLTFSAPPGRGQGLMNQVTLAELRQQAPNGAAKGSIGENPIPTMKP
eukprot:4977649-Pyramimonas_sp.AAC.1